MKVSIFSQGNAWSTALLMESARCSDGKLSLRFRPFQKRFLPGLNMQDFLINCIAHMYIYVFDLIFTNIYLWMEIKDFFKNNLDLSLSCRLMGVFKYICIYLNFL